MKSPTAIHPLARPILLAALLPLATMPATAALVVQTQAFSYPASGSGSSGPTYLVGASGVSRSFTPFSASLGTLNAFQIVWDAVMGATGTTAAFNGGVYLSYGGQLFVDSISYGGMGDNRQSPTDQPAGTAVSLTLPTSDTTNFPVLSANPAILAKITGPSAFNLIWDGGAFTAMYVASSMQDYTVDFSGTVKLTYDYTEAVPVPGPFWYAPFAALLLWRRRQPTQGRRLG